MADDNGPLNINLGTAARYAAGGALGGAALASAINLVHMLRDMDSRRKEKEEPSETDEGTVVLTLPKRAESESESSRWAALLKKFKARRKDKKSDGSGDVEKPAMAGSQVKHYDGQYGKSVKTANWQTLATAMLAMGAGGTVGYMVADKIYQNKRVRDKEQELQEARQEYLDMLTANAPKTAAAGEANAFNAMDYPIGAAVLALLMGGGATAWLTKRVLDEYMLDRDKPRGPKPEVRRIVFKSASELDDGGFDKEASDTAQALVGVYLDICSGSPDILGAPECAAELAKAGETPDTLYKKAAGGSDDYYSLVATLDANPELRKLLQRMTMRKHPILKYFTSMVGLPGIRGMADSRLYKAVDEQFNPARMKTAALPVGSMIGGLTGSALLANTVESSRVEARLKELVEEMKAKKDEENDAAQNGGASKEDVDVVAADPDAARFLAQNKDKIHAALVALDRSGKL